MSTNGPKDTAPVDGRGAQTKKKRFYKDAAVSDTPPFQVLLDGRVLKTPAKRDLTLPNEPLARRVASEWASQGAVIDPLTLPLTRLANSAIDGVADMTQSVSDEIVRFVGHDLVSYRAESPADLVELQSRHWDPLLSWVREALGVHLQTGEGVMPVTQSDEVFARFAAGLPGNDPFKLAALHVMTTLTGSAVIALAHGRGFVSADTAWTAAHVDEDYQISQWGVDSEAAGRRTARRVEFDAASELYEMS